MATQGGFSQGGFSQGGFSQGGFSQGGFGTPVGFGFTLADGYANPITMGALVTHRDATVEPREEDLDIKEPASKVENFERWEPWVRAAIAQQELLSQVSVHGLAGAARRMATVKVRNGAGEKAIATLTAPGVEDFKLQLALVLSWAELREERASEILAQIDNQFAFLAAVLHMNPSRMRRTFELLAIAIQFAVAVEMRVKHELACWRPAEYSPRVQPMITTPGHGSLPSGHATQAYMVAHLLRRLTGTQPRSPVDIQLQRQAARIATNRVIAGVHFPADSMAGRLLGQALGEYFVAISGKREVVYSYEFLGDKVSDQEFRPSLQEFDGSVIYKRHGPCSSLKASELMKHLWKKAAEEWDGRVFPTWPSKP